MDRRLCAILAADIAGYSRMMREDETRTIAAIERLRSEVFGPIFADHRGEILKSMGDGWLVAFQSSVDAVNAALCVQDRLAHENRLKMRMGVHIGDVTQGTEDVYGDGLNIAVRLEAEAPEGGLLISDAVHGNLDGTLSQFFVEAGPRHLKNIDRAVLTWLRAPAVGREPTGPTSRDLDFPSLAIAPIETVDDRVEVQDLAHALTADLHTFFCSAAWLRSAIATDAPPGAYVLRAALRSRGERLRLEARILDPDGKSVWSHKSDTTLEDTFDWQDAVAEEIAIQGIEHLFEIESLRLARIPEEALTAEQCHLLGILNWRTFSVPKLVESLKYHKRAIELRPDLPDPYSEAIINVVAGRNLGADASIKDFIALMPDWIAAARPLAAGHATLTCAIGIADYKEDGRLPALNTALEQAIRLTPFDSKLLAHCGWGYIWSGQAARALETFERSLRYGPHGPLAVACLGGCATACVQLGRDDEALAFCDRGLAMSDGFPTFHCVRAAAYALKGDMEKAQAAMSLYLEFVPTQTLATWKRYNNYGESDGGERYFDGLRRAGLPEE